MIRAAWFAAVMLAIAAAPGRAQQPSIQIGAATQVITGDETRLGGQHRVEPDLNIQLFDPGFRFGNLYADLNVTRRNDRAVMGRAMLRLEGGRMAGMTWSVDGGNTSDAPAVGDFGFSNLFAPPVMLQGASIRGSSRSTSLVVSAGRVMAQRNIFGTDNLAIGQQLFQASLSHRVSERLDISARGVYVRTGQVQLYPAFTDRSTDVGGGIRYRPGSSVQLIADGGLTAF